MAIKKDGGVNSAAQAEITPLRSETPRSLAQLALDYHWARAMFDPAHTDAQVNAAGDQVEAIVGAISNTRAKSICDLRAKLAIFRSEEDGEITDHNALALIESIYTDLHTMSQIALSGEPDIADSTALHQRHYDALLSAVAAMRAGNDDEGVSDETRDAQAAGISEAFDDLMECPAGDFASILLKIKGAQVQAFNTMEGSCVSPRVYGELLGIIAADLEIVMQAQRNKREG